MGAFSRNVLVAGSVGKDEITLSVSPNPSFVVAQSTNINVRFGFEKVWEKVSGTSFSAPQVTAVAAMMMAINPKLSADQIRQSIICSARGSRLQKNTIYDASLDANGYMLPEAGMLDALTAVDLAIASVESLDLTSINTTCKVKNGSQKNNACCTIF
jgi:predicted XRE-type DNA-binding protein